MPFEIRKEGPEGKPFCVFTKGKDGKNHGCHESEEKAKKQLAALYANVPEASMDANTVAVEALSTGLAFFAEWTTEKRKALPKEDFGDPERELYPISDQDDVDSAAKLIGKAHNPEAVKSRIKSIAKRKGLKIPDAWQDGKGKAKMAAFSMTVTTPGPEGFIIKEGPIFKAGIYEDKSFSLTPDELKAAAGGPAIKLGDTHAESLFDGKLGDIIQTWPSEDGLTLFGRAQIPIWVQDVLGEDPLQVSCVWDRQTKKLSGVDFVPNPRVTDAALFAAFANRHDTGHGQDALQRHHDLSVQQGAVCNAPVKMASKHEHSAIQHIHDHTVEHGAKCHGPLDRAMGIYPMFDNQGQQQTQQNSGDQVRIDAQAGAGGTARMSQETKPSLWDTLKAALGGRTEEKPAAVAQPDPASEARFAEERNRRIKAEATAFAQEMFMRNRITAAQVQSVEAEFSQAALDDENHPQQVSFSVGAEQKIGTRIDLMRARYEASPSHVLTEEKIPDGVAAFNNKAETEGAKGKDDTSVDPERVKKFLAHTPLGQVAAARKNGEK